MESASVHSVDFSRTFPKNINGLRLPNQITTKRAIALNLPSSCEVTFSGRLIKTQIGNQRFTGNILT